MATTESKQHAVTAESAYVVSANVLSKVTAEGLLGVIFNHKSNNYTLTPVGQGCRYRLFIVFNDLAEGVVLEEVSDTVKNALGTYWPSPSGTPPVPGHMARNPFRA